ncbi:MAG: HypC/HybG/HupF family hydrogenase formation chaperone [Sutterella sp.]|nr:HypC/HybG/HupF family hydrogenase formation chaperone [Sutterella sp.]
MCLAVPGQIRSTAADGTARCAVGGIEKTVDVSLIEDPKPGDWVIVHVGFALTRIDEKEAEATIAALKAAGAAEPIQEAVR